jgi:hypothetical protein
LRYVSRLEARNGPLVAAMNHLAEQIPRFGLPEDTGIHGAEGALYGAGRCVVHWCKADLQVQK